MKAHLVGGGLASQVATGPDALWIRALAQFDKTA